MLLDGVNTVANTDSLFANSLIKLKVLLLDGVDTVANTDSLFANSLIKLKVLLLDGVDTIKYSTLNTDAFRVTKVYNGHYLAKIWS